MVAVFVPEPLFFEWMDELNAVGGVGVEEE